MIKADRKYTVTAYIVLTVLAVLMIFPFLWMIFSSFKPSWEIYDMALLPKSPTLDNYKNIFEFSGFPKWFLNSTIVAVITTLSVLFFDSLVGFTLAKYKFPGRKILFILILSTLMIPTEMLVIPWYAMSQKLNWMGSYWSLMFPGMISGFGIFLMKQFMGTIPDELLDAARIDGLSEFKIYWKIVLPLVKPALGTLAIFNFIGNWNAFLWPLIVAQDSSMYTLPVGMAYFSSEASFQWEQIMTGATISTIPLIIFFLIFQKQIIQGIATQGLKG